MPRPLDAPMVPDRNSDRPVYHQIADYLRDAIRDGVLQPGQSLPSETELTEIHQVSRMAVRKAVGLLCNEGLVTVQRGQIASVRPPVERHVVTLYPGERLRSRMLTEPERNQRGTDRGIPVIEITRASGNVDLYDADRTDVIPASATPWALADR